MRARAGGSGVDSCHCYAIPSLAHACSRVARVALQRAREAIAVRGSEQSVPRGGCQVHKSGTEAYARLALRCRWRCGIGGFRCSAVDSSPSRKASVGVERLEWKKTHSPAFHT